MVIGTEREDYSQYSWS